MDRFGVGWCPRRALAVPVRATVASAAWWHGMLDRLPRKVMIAMPVNSRRSPPDGIDLHRRALPQTDVVVRLDVPLVAGPLAALAAAAELGVRGPVFLDRASGRGIRDRCRVPGCSGSRRVDGWAWHVDVERFQADRRRQNRLVAAGWTVLRFTWHDLTGRPAEVIAEIRVAVARAGGTGRRSA